MELNDLVTSLVTEKQKTDLGISLVKENEELT
jgi:hypothetical protein